MIPLFYIDPHGDDHGLGYAYPTAALYAESGFADLTGFQAIDQRGQLVLRVRLARYPNPAKAPLGFSLATIAIYVDSRPGGSEDLPGAGFRTPKGQGWDQAYLITGWDSSVRTPAGGNEPLVVERQGEWIEFRPGLPPGNYGYYVATGLYDPFAPWNFRPLRPGGGPWVIDGPAGAPAAVDVLATSQARSYSTGVLRPVKASPSRWSLALLSGLLGLLFIALSYRFPKSSPPRRPRRV